MAWWVEPEFKAGLSLLAAPTVGMLRINTRRLTIENLGDVPEMYGGYEMLVDPTTGWTYATGPETFSILDYDGSQVVYRARGGYGAMDVERRQYYLVCNEISYYDGYQAYLDVVSMDTGEVLYREYVGEQGDQPVVDDDTGEVWLTSSRTATIKVFS